MKRSTWLNPEGASPEVLHQLQAAVGALPATYLDLLARGNGGETRLRVDPFVLGLDSAEAALDYWNSGTYTASEVFVFGGDRGGTLLAFDLSRAGEWPVVEFDPIDPEGSMRIVAPTFEALIARVEDNEA